MHRISGLFVGLEADAKISYYFSTARVKLESQARNDRQVPHQQGSLSDRSELREPIRRSSRGDRGLGLGTGSTLQKHPSFSAWDRMLIPPVNLVGSLGFERSQTQPCSYLPVINLTIHVGLATLRPTAVVIVRAAVITSFTTCITSARAGIDRAGSASTWMTT